MILFQQISFSFSSTFSLFRFHKEILQTKIEHHTQFWWYSSIKEQKEQGLRPESTQDSFPWEEIAYQTLRITKRKKVFLEKIQETALPSISSNGQPLLWWVSFGFPSTKVSIAVMTMFIIEIVLWFGTEWEGGTEVEKKMLLSLPYNEAVFLVIFDDSWSSRIWSEVDWSHIFLLLNYSFINFWRSTRIGKRFLQETEMSLGWWLNSWRRWEKWSDDKPEDLVRFKDFFCSLLFSPSVTRGNWWNSLKLRTWEIRLNHIVKI